MVSYLCQGDLLTSVDLANAYFHIPICPCHPKLLIFSYCTECTLPFSLLSAPVVFMKMLLVVIAMFRLQGTHLYAFLQDILVEFCSRLWHTMLQCKLWTFCKTLIL